MGLLLLFASWVDAQIPQLGPDDWATREAAHTRLDHFLPALFLPFRSEDPEIDLRLRALRTRNLKWFDPAYLERVLHCRDFRQWLVWCVLEGDSVAFTLDEIFLELHGSFQKAALYMEMAGRPRWSVPSWLQGQILPGEFEEFKKHRQAYRDQLAPRPRELP